MDNNIRFVVGLGNPGEPYRNTPHNLGRALVEFLQSRDNVSWKKDRSYEWTDGRPSYVRLNSFMNVSGQAVSELLNWFKCGPESLLVCVDDFDLPMGTIRLRRQGSAGTHNGLKSLVEHLGPEFARMRLGVGPIPPGADAARYVLAPFSKAQREAANAMLERAATAVDVAVSGGIDVAMNQFNAGV